MKPLIKLILMLLVLNAPATRGGARYGGGELYTKESFLYGRFEVRMKSAEGGGIVSSFFLYNVDQPCVDGISEVKRVAISSTFGSNAVGSRCNAKY